MSDLISRQAAIDALKEHRALFCNNTPDSFSKLPYGEKCRVDELNGAIATLVNLPSAQPEPCEDAVSRDSVSKWLDRWEGYIDKDIINRMQYKVCDIPSVKPDIPIVDTPTVDTPNCDDVVSREDVINMIDKRMDQLTQVNFGTRTFQDGVYDGYARIRSDMKSLPFVRPERKKGKWRIEPGIGCYCTNCGFDIGNDIEMEYANYCPNCGAEMEGQDDSI